MKKDPVFLSIDQVLQLHEHSIEAHGGDAGLRDRGLLESAVAMPEACFGGVYLHQSMVEMATAYLFHISKNHAFVDGNKRTSVLAAEVFLRVNGYDLTATDEELEKIALGVADSTISKSELSKAVSKFVKRTRR